MWGTWGLLPWKSDVTSRASALGARIAFMVEKWWAHETKTGGGEEEREVPKFEFKKKKKGKTKNHLAKYLGVNTVLLALPPGNRRVHIFLPAYAKGLTSCSQQKVKKQSKNRIAKIERIWHRRLNRQPQNLRTQTPQPTLDVSVVLNNSTREAVGKAPCLPVPLQYWFLMDLGGECQLRGEAGKGVYGIITSSVRKQTMDRSLKATSL